MATKVVVISDTKIGGKHVDAGTELTYDELTNEGRTHMGELNAANRIVIHGSEGHKLWLTDQEKLKEQAAAAKAAAKAAARPAAKGNGKEKDEDEEGAKGDGKVKKPEGEK